MKILVLSILMTVASGLIDVNTKGPETVNPSIVSTVQNLFAMPAAHALTCGSAGASCNPAVPGSCCLGYSCVAGTCIN